jgi:hypothetical protein
MFKKKIEKASFFSKTTWYDRGFEWSEVVWPIFLIILFIGFQFLLDRYGLYRDVAEICVLMTIYFIVKVFEEQISMYLKGYIIQFFKDRIEIRVLGSHISGKFRLIINPKSIQSFDAYSEFKTWLFPGEIGKLPRNGTKDWTDWIALLDSYRDYVPAIAFKLEDENFVLQCREIEKVISILHELYGIQGVLHDSS